MKLPRDLSGEGSTKDCGVMMSDALMANRSTEGLKIFVEKREVVGL